MTEGYAIFVSVILGFILYSGFKLYSVIVIGAWSVSVIIFLGVDIYELSILVFYFSIITTVMLIALAATRYSQVA